VNVAKTKAEVLGLPANTTKSGKHPHALSLSRSAIPMPNVVLCYLPDTNTHIPPSMHMLLCIHYGRPM